MKILIVPSWYYSNNTENTAGVFFKEFAEALSDAGHEVAIMHFEIKFDAKGLVKGFSHTKVNGVHEFRYAQKNFTPKSAIGVECQKLMKLESMCKLIEKDFGRPDVIHLESSVMINIAQKIKKRWGIPIAYTEHLSNLLAENPAKFYRVRFEKAMKLADACIAISSVYESKMRQYNPKFLARIPNGLKTESFKLSASPDVFKVKALGSLRKIKGYDILISAFAEFAKDKENVFLEIGGDGSERSGLECLIDELNIAEKVKLTGNVPREKIAEFYDETSVFVCSSFIETFSVVTAEALCSGIPTIATRCGGPQDMIDEINGILVDVNDKIQLTSALEEIYINEADYNRKNIQQRAAIMFDYSNVVAANVEVYIGVINGETRKC